MADTSYEIHYWQFTGFADVPRMLLEAGKAKYENVFVNRMTEWPGTLKDKTRYGHIPKLVIKTPEGSKDLFEEQSIAFYLADALGFLPSNYPTASTYEKAQFVSIFTSWNEVAMKYSTIFLFPDSIMPKKPVLAQVAKEVLPNTFKFHDRILKNEGGPFYYGDKPTLVDFMAFSIILRSEELEGDQIINEYPHVLRLKEAMLAIPEVKEYVEKRRDFGLMVFDKNTSNYTLSPAALAAFQAAQAAQAAPNQA